MEVELIKRDGEVSMEKSFDYLCSLLRNGIYSLKITRKTAPRTVNQNALMWMWFTCLEADSGQSKDDWHDYYCAKFLSRQVQLGDRIFTVPGKTSRLNTIQFTEFLNKIQADAATEWGVALPLPADRFFDVFVDEYKDRI